MALATLSQLKTQLGLQTSDTRYDTKLTLFLDAASAYIESYCERTFASATYTELFNGNRSNILSPRHYPITAISELRVSSERDWTDASALIDTDDYGISQDQLTIVYYATYFPKGFNNVRIQYTAGYATVPTDLQLACLWVAEWFYLHNTRGDSGRTSVSKQGESISVLTDIPPMVKTLLQPYRRIELPSNGLATDHL